MISRHVHEQWRNINQAVDAIQDSAMPRNRRTHILGSDVSFDHADGKIAKQSTDSDNQPGENQLRRAEKWKRESQQPGQNYRNSERAKRAFPRFVRTDFAAKRMPSKPSAKCKRADVIQFGREDNVTKKSVGVGGVRQKTQMSEHPADVNKANDAQRHLLQFAAGAVAQDRNEQDQHDSENRHSHKKSIPTCTRLLAARMRYPGCNADRNDPGVTGARHPPVAIQSRRASEFLEPKNRKQCHPNNDRNASCENNQQPDRRHHKPRTIGCPDRAKPLLKSPMEKT